MTKPIQFKSIFENKEIYDITPVINANLAVFPGDTPFCRHEVMSFVQGNNLTLSHINTTVHLGAHTDAPSHYHPKGVSIEKRSIDQYIGHCQVISVSTAKGQRIQISDLEQKVQATKVLFKSLSFPNPYIWQDNFCSLSLELVDFLNSLKVTLIGIDTPSVDLSSDKELECHNQIFKYDMAILEGIVLNDVSPGHYDMMAVPLPIEGADASPVRAILIK